MMNRNTAAIFFAAIPAEKRAPLFALLRAEGRILDTTLDRSFRGCGNAAARRQGIDTQWYGCGCDVCVVYGGDCAAQMWREDHTRWHLERRGVKTRGVA